MLSISYSNCVLLFCISRNFQIVAMLKQWGSLEFLDIQTIYHVKLQGNVICPLKALNIWDEINKLNTASPRMLSKNETKQPFTSHKLSNTL